MIIDANLLPFSVDELVKSKAWHDATPEQRRKFISASVTFDTVLTHYADKYHAKKTVKGEFIACVLWDFYYDLFSDAVEQSNGFDFGLDYYYENNIDNFSERLLGEALHPKRWIKVLKQAYQENRKDIIKGATDENGNIDLDLINDFSVEYRDYLYQRKEILGVWDKMGILTANKFNLYDSQDGTTIQSKSRQELISIAQFMIKTDPITEEYFPSFDQSLEQAIDILKFNDYKVSVDL